MTSSSLRSLEYWVDFRANMTNERQINRNGFFPIMNLSCLLLLTTDLNWLCLRTKWTGKPQEGQMTPLQRSTERVFGPRPCSQDHTTKLRADPLNPERGMAFVWSEGKHFTKVLGWRKTWQDCRWDSTPARGATESIFSASDVCQRNGRKPKGRRPMRWWESATSSWLPMLGKESASVVTSDALIPLFNRTSRVLVLPIQYRALP